MDEPTVLYSVGMVFIGAAVGSSPCLREPLAKCWRPRIAGPIATLFIVGVAYFFKLVSMPAIIFFTEVGPIFNMSGWEVYSLLTNVKEVSGISPCLAVPQAVETARALGLLELTGGSAVTAQQASRHANVTENGVRCVFEALAEAGVLWKATNGSFHHTWSKPALDWIFTLTEFTNTVDFPTSVHLTDAVRTGKPAGLHNVFGPQFRSLYHARSEVPRLVAWTNYMNWVNKVTVAIMFSRLGGRLSKIARLLDMCGNEGQNAILLARRYTSMHITVHDLPAVIHDPERGTAMRIRQAGLEGRVSVFPRDLTEPGDIPWPRNDFDAVQLVHCINEWPLDELRNRLSSVRTAVAPGGWFFIVGHFGFTKQYKSKMRNRYAMVYFMTATGDGASLYELDQLRDVAEEVGFIDIKVELLDFGISAISGRKPL